jgi:acyl carrier protein
MMENKYKQIKALLAEMLGIDVEDISDEDFLADDLHMSPSEISDFLAKLEDAGIDTSSVDVKEIETFADLADALGAREE